MSDSTRPPYQCSTCQGAKMNSRNLAVFIDGTSNKPGDQNTNVRKLFHQVHPVGDGSEPKQDKKYLEGIGAHYTEHLPLLDRMGKVIYSSFEMAFAWNVEKNIKDAYTWLARTYQEGDRIYLFGFSRGAYQVRALAAMIHEVGLVIATDDVDLAYGHYRSTHRERRQNRIMFRKESCRNYVRIHFVGVWDTVSSLGLVKKDAQITASATITNACFFRQALALDEHRVKFMPEYFTEVNAHRREIGIQRFNVGNVKEVWFAGSHSDVGGTSRKYTEVDSSAFYPVHAGNAPLLWMRREAAANGLFFKPEEFTWDPKDVDDGRKDTMTLLWKFLEFLPVRHQVSFSGAGKHERRFHLSRARSVIPNQQIHSSILSCNAYAPSATLRADVDIPTGAQEASNRLWTAELPDEGATMHLLTSFLSDQQETLKSLEKVLFLLFRMDNGLAQTITIPQWIENSIRKPSGSDKFALTVIYDVISNFAVPEGLLEHARTSLFGILNSPEDSPVFRILRFSASHERLRRHLFTPDVIGALMHALRWTARSPNENLFPLVMDSLHYLINDNRLRNGVISHLCPGPDETNIGQTRLSVALKIKAPSQLMAWLKMIVSFARYRADLCQELKPKIFELAKMKRNSVGSTAVEALVALNEPLHGNIHIVNILGYLNNILPPLDAEVNSSTSPDNIGDLPPGLHVIGSEELDITVMRKLVMAIESRNARERTLATLTLLKLCRNSMIREFCSRAEVMHTFTKQLERKEMSLLAAYALKECLGRGMPLSDPDRTAQLIVGMLTEGWFDDAVGQVEGFDILRGLMTSEDLRQRVVGHNIIPTLLKKLEGGKRHDVRTSLICLDIFAKECLQEMMPIVEQSILDLQNSSEKMQRKSVMVLAAFAQTTAGERAISQRAIDIVRMLPLLPSGSSRWRSQPLGPAAAIYSLSKNETLRRRIKESPEFSKWRIQYRRRTGAAHF